MALMDAYRLGVPDGIDGEARAWDEGRKEADEDERQPHEPGGHISYCYQLQ